MAPVATSPTPSTIPLPQVKSLEKRNGADLESKVDAIEDIALYKAEHPDVPLPGHESEEWRNEKSKFDQDKDKEDFRKYEDAAQSVKDFYKEQHEKQTVEYNLAARKKFVSTSPGFNPNAQLTIWEAIEKLDTLIDESDPDTSLSQIQHLLQTAEAMRRDGKPDWMCLTGLLHDLGKLLFFFGAEGQWDVVGDTFVVGCAHEREAIVYPDTFDGNPDSKHEVYGTKYGIYEPNCGLDNVMLSFGHDEYLFWILKENSSLPQAALDMVRYHSFYPWHSRGAYKHLMKGKRDEEALQNVLAFNPYDLYSKSDAPPKVEDLKEYYQGLIDKYIHGGRDQLINW